MDNKNFITGLVVLTAGLFASSISSILEHFAVLGSATDLTRGFFDGLSAVAFGIAIFVLLHSKRTKG